MISNYADNLLNPSLMYAFILFLLFWILRMNLSFV